VDDDVVSVDPNDGVALFEPKEEVGDTPNDGAVSEDEPKFGVVVDPNVVFVGDVCFEDSFNEFNLVSLSTFVLQSFEEFDSSSFPEFLTKKNK
jgi:hypothetical protein